MHFDYYFNFKAYKKLVYNPYLFLKAFNKRLQGKGIVFDKNLAVKEKEEDFEEMVYMNMLPFIYTTTPDGTIGNKINTVYDAIKKAELQAENDMLLLVKKALL